MAFFAVPGPQECAVLPSSPSECSNDDGNTAAFLPCSPADSLPMTSPTVGLWLLLNYRNITFLAPAPHISCSPPDSLPRGISHRRTLVAAELQGHRPPCSSSISPFSPPDSLTTNIVPSCDLAAAEHQEHHPPCSSSISPLCLAFKAGLLPKQLIESKTQFQ